MINPCLLQNGGWLVNPPTSQKCWPVGLPGLGISWHGNAPHGTPLFSSILSLGVILKRFWQQKSQPYPCVGQDVQFDTNICAKRTQHTTSVCLCQFSVWYQQELKCFNFDTKNVTLKPGPKLRTLQGLYVSTESMVKLKPPSIKVLENHHPFFG